MAVDHKAPELSVSVKIIYKPFHFMAFLIKVILLKESLIGMFFVYVTIKYFDIGNTN